MLYLKKLIDCFNSLNHKKFIQFMNSNHKQMYAVTQTCSTKCSLFFILGRLKSTLDQPMHGLEQQASTYHRDLG